MTNKQRSWFGFWASLLLHCALLGGIAYALQSDDSANGYQADRIDTSISMEMLQGMMVEPEPVPAPEPEPEVNPEPQPVAKEDVPDPTQPPEKVQEVKKEKPKETKKEKPKEKPAKKEPAKPKQEKPNKAMKNKDLPKGDRNVDSAAKIDSVATGLGKATVDNPNWVGKGNSADEVKAYIAALRKEIERNKHYPQRAKLMRKQGIATIHFHLRQDGSIINVSIKNSSGNSDLDAAALNAVRNTRPIGPRPLTMQEINAVPIRFSLRN